MKDSNREDEIINLLEETPEHYLTVSALATHFNVSESTIRRDLARLYEQHKISKMHGGAAPLNYAGQFLFDNGDREFPTRAYLEPFSKRAIAAYVSSLIKPGSCVYLDASTTVATISDFVTAEKNVLFVTNSPDICNRMTSAGHRTLLTGGELKTSTSAFVGEYAENFLDEFNFNLGFFGTNAIHPTACFTTPDYIEAMMKKKAISRTYQAYVLADHTKFDKIAAVTFATFKDAILIADQVPERYKTLVRYVDLSAKKD